MNSLLTSSLCITALATTLLLSPAAVFASDATPNDRAQLMLATAGSIAVHAAGPYVAAGTFRIQVAAKLGQPSVRRADGTWLYKNFSAAESAANGTLIVRFDPRGRVSELSLATPAVVEALLTPGKVGDARVLVAKRDRW